MKSLWTIISVLAVMHILGLIGSVGWLVASGRLDTDRAQSIKDMLKTTVAEQKALEEEQSNAKGAGEGDTNADQTVPVNIPKSAKQQIEEDQKQHEIMLLQLERTRKEVSQLQRNLELAQIKIKKERAENLKIKDSLEKQLADIKAQRDEEGFKKVIELYESLPSKAVKQVFVQLIEQGKQPQVVDYLEAMDNRKAAGVLKEFKNQTEVTYVVELTEMLRQRGSKLVESLENTI